MLLRSDFFKKMLKKVFFVEQSASGSAFGKQFSAKVEFLMGTLRDFSKELAEALAVGDRVNAWLAAKKIAGFVQRQQKRGRKVRSLQEYEAILAMLDDTQRQIVRFKNEGLDDRAIAEQLGLSLHTVQRKWAYILAKLHI